MISDGNTYPLLCELTGTLIFAVTEEFDDTTFIWCKTVVRNISVCKGH
jgi:hypothetical protein